jgi:hypothetical protein
MSQSLPSKTARNVSNYLMTDNIHTAIAIPHKVCADLLDATFKSGLIGATGFVVICGSVDFQDAAGRSNQKIPFLTNRIDQLALPSRP